jgi:PDZ domain-containing protein
MSVSVTTENAIAAAISVASTAPAMTAMPALATTAHARRQAGVGWCISVSTSATAIGGRAADERVPRAGGAVALAGFRHPAAISATMASPAIQAESVVSSVIDTQSDMVPTPLPPVRTPAAVHRWWAVPLTVVGFIALLGLLTISVLPATTQARTESGEDAQFAQVPSDAELVADRLDFDAVERYPADGSFLFVTVREPEITLLDWLVSDGLREVRLLSYRDKVGDQTPEQDRQFSLEMMRTAKETAEYVALDHLGYPAEIIPGDVIVLDLVCLEANEDGTECVDWAPSDDVLDPGDKLLSVDGTALETIDDLSAILADHQPGDVVTVEYERPDEGTRTGDIELIASGDGTDRTIVGFRPFDTASADLPFSVDIDSGAIGGPSAGLAFTLTLIDELTPGELTGGQEVAVTGAIEIDGSVGAIGGLVSKTSAVKQRGAKVFIVPSAQGEENIAEARLVAGDELDIIPVDNLDQALAALADYGGNGLELGTPGADYVPSE